VLVVDDESAVAPDDTHLALRQIGLDAVDVTDGTSALDLLTSRGGFDLVVVDLTQPGSAGLEVCREIRSSSPLPVVIVSDHVEVGDVVAGLELGADDYVTKPFDPRELAARIRALLRRAHRADDEILVVQDLHIDVVGAQVEQAGVIVSLTPTELRLLVELARNAGQVLTRATLLQRVWATDYLGGSRLVDVAVKRLRDKLHDAPRDSRYITTVRGAGYRLERGASDIPLQVSRS
jgi:two-component system response regulator MtrA